MSTTEPRALTAALQSPAFVTRGGGLAMHVANRHVERWAPETSASRFRPLRNLGFVDRLVAPWIESAQRSASLRMFSEVISSGVSERAPTSTTSWLLPRPWYQDELDWMAAARESGAQRAMEQSSEPSMLTTRGTYVASVPSAVYEYIAPSLSVARPNEASDAYSPLVPFAATHAAHVMSRAVAPLGARALSPGLRAVLSTMLERATHEAAPTRTSLSAPRLETPPAPRGPAETDNLADRYAEQHAQLAEVQRMARLAAERELASREVALAPQPRPVATSDVQVSTARGQSLHEYSRQAALRDARIAASTPVEAQPVEPRTENRVAVEIAEAVAALPPELSAMVTASIGQRPERAVQAIAELGDALRSVELIARNTGTFEPARGPRVVMPAGLGGLLSTVERSTDARDVRVPTLPIRRAAPTTALGAAAATKPAALQHVAWSDRWLARFAGAQPQTLDLLSAASSDARMRVLAKTAPDSVFVAPIFEDRSDRPREDRELGFDVGFGRTRTQEPLPTLRGGPAPAQPVLRIDDNAETPDDMLAAISFAATRSRAAASAPPSTAPTVSPTPTVDPERLSPRETLADIVAHAAPSAPGAGLSAQLASSPFAPALRHVLPLAVAPSFDVRALFGAGLSATYLAGLVSAATDEVSVRAGVGFEPTYVAPDSEADKLLTTLRSALLSVDIETDGAGRPLARTLVESLALPMLSDAAATDVTGASARDRSYAAPGMIADRAHAWSVAQELSASDLSFDFVPPELVLAARVYGLGPAEAAQAARLAIGGPGQLGAMASAVDRTFVQAMAIESERRGERARIATAYPTTADAGVASQSTFGVERRAPRGAFMWPAASMAALGMNATGADGQPSTSVAALELLAAHAVAELGTYSALSDDERPARSDGPTRDRDELATAAAQVPAGRRDKFEALYIALSQSPSGRTSSPSARAARALALAGRGDETISARERATVAWDVLPMVYGMTDADDAPISTGDAAARALRRRDELRALDPVFVDSRPGLAGLSARAGEALGSYVAPSPAAPAASSPREVGAVLRAPTAAQELVQTGRPAGRHGGGEVEIPAWFEQAARKMFEERSVGISDGISLAELTLVNSAPATQIAASSRTASSSRPPVSSNATSAPASEGQAIDVEKVANDVYREVLVLMDIARARNGEPYL